MIKYINGILGGGKTALAVAYIYSIAENKQIKKPIFKDPDFKKGYTKIYSNISGLNKDDFEGRLEFLNFDIIDKCALAQATLIEGSKHIQSIDTVLNKFWDDVASSVEFYSIESEFDLESIGYLYEDIKGFQFNHVLIVIDEVVQFFDQNKPYLRDWFNYSRHIFQDMILIQNSLADVHSSYKNEETVKHFIRAADASSRLHPQYFKYAYFDSHKQTKSSQPKIKNIWIPTWIFEKYDCGKAQNAFPEIYKYAIGTFFLIGLVVYMMYGILNPEPKQHSQSPPVNTDNQVYSNMNDLNISDSQTKYKDIACFRCGKKSCVYKNEVFSFDKFKYFQSVYNMELAYKEKHYFFVDYCYEVDEAFIDLYEIKPLNENPTLFGKIL